MIPYKNAKDEDILFAIIKEIVSGEREQNGLMDKIVKYGNFKYKKGMDDSRVLLSRKFVI